MVTADLYLIYDEALDLALLSELAPDRRLIGLKWDQRDTPPERARVLLNLEAEQIRSLVPLALQKQWEIGLLPHAGSRQVMRAYGVTEDLEEVFRQCLRAEAIEADVLTCNGQVIFSSVVIGKALTLGPYSSHQPPTLRATLRNALEVLMDLRLGSYTLVVGEEQKFELAALGMVVMDHTQSSLIGRSFSETLDMSDGRLSLLAFAPRSVLSYIWSAVRLLLPKKISLSRLPGAVGLISSEHVLLESPREIDYSLDGAQVTAMAVEFRVLDQRLRLLPGPELVAKEDRNQTRNRIRMGHLPMGETARKLAETPLPLFSRASEEEYRDLFVALRENAALSSPFLVLMVLSVLLALTGLYANSAPVIIGAMILAPLMAPIISLAMGLARMEPTLIRNSLRTLGVGVGAALFCAVSVAWLMPLENVTLEMRARLSPTLLDLSVAVISGIAGAYAHAKEEIAKSLAGVAIAVALVPPLSVVGIGVGWGDWAMAKGASLLFVTNLVGISLAAVATFLVLGFAPFKLARKGLAIATVLLAVVLGPLYIAFVDLVEEGKILRQIPTGEIELAGQPVNLRIVRVRTGTPPLVRVTLSASRRLDESHVDALKQLIVARAGRSILLEAQLNLRR